MQNARGIAVNALCKVETDGAYSNLTLANALSEAALSPQDKAFCTQLFYGTLDRKLTIDYILKQFIKTPLKKVKPYTLSVLRSGVYQIKFMDRIPESAAVNEAVKLVKSSAEAYGSGFVNGVLRNVVRTEIVLPEGNDTKALSVRYSCPEWLVSLLIKDYGVQTAQAFLEKSLEAPPVFLRVNPYKTSADSLYDSLTAKGLSVNRCALENALALAGVPGVESLAEYQNGLFHVEDLSCQAAISALDIQPNDRILDVCAAPGGKAFTAAEYASCGAVAACDLYEHRTGLIRQGADRLGLGNVEAICRDAAVFDSALGSFDAVICDVPCSGFGVIRRKPDIKYKPCSSFKELIHTQKSIAENACRYLRSGGKLLYSTCTLHKAENEENVRYLLETHGDFKLLYEHTFMPHTDGTDGFYAAVLKKG